MNFWWLTLSAAGAILLSMAYLPLLNSKTNTNGNIFSNFFNSLSSRTVLEVADVIVTNGTIYTSDDSLPFAESMAIHKGRIIHVGNYSSIKDLSGSETKVLNLEGKIVVPGLIDSHVHLIFGGLQMARVELRGVNFKENFVNKVEVAVRSFDQEKRHLEENRDPRLS